MILRFKKIIFAYLLDYVLSVTAFFILTPTLTIKPINTNTIY
jgi:hypothetical protein